MRKISSPAVPTAHVWVAKGLTAYTEIVLTAQGHIIIFFTSSLSSGTAIMKLSPLQGSFMGLKLEYCQCRPVDGLVRPSVCSVCV